MSISVKNKTKLVPYR